MVLGFETVMKFVHREFILINDFMGLFNYTINSCRVVIPAQFRVLLNTEPSNTVICTLGKNNCIMIFSHSNWEVLRSHLKDGDIEKENMWSYLIYHASIPQQLDKKGRIRISDKLLNKSGITNKVII